MGPALLAWNNARFEAKDFEAIQHPQDREHSTKAGDVIATGRFGIGFNSVYHITDMPCILSGDVLAICDPASRLRPAAVSHKPGIRRKFHHWQEHDLRMFDGICDFSLKSSQQREYRYPYTLFRFPLRTEQMLEAVKQKSKGEGGSKGAKPKFVSELSYSNDAVEKLFDAFRADIEQVLLFLRNVESVELCRVTVEGKFLITDSVQLGDVQLVPRSISTLSSMPMGGSAGTGREDISCIGRSERGGKMKCVPDLELKQGRGDIYRFLRMWRDKVSSEESSRLSPQRLCAALLQLDDSSIQVAYTFTITISCLEESAIPSIVGSATVLPPSAPSVQHITSAAAAAAATPGFTYSHASQRITGSIAPLSSSKADMMMERQRKWLVVEQLGGQAACMFGREEQTKFHVGIRLVPWGAVAAPLDGDAAAAGRCSTTLPLPLRTSFPVNINGSFELDDSRRAFTVASRMLSTVGEVKDGIGTIHSTNIAALTADELKSQWNALLLQSVVAEAWLELIQLACVSGLQTPQAWQQFFLQPASLDDRNASWTTESGGLPEANSSSDCGTGDLQALSRPSSGLNWAPLTDMFYRGRSLYEYNLYGTLSSGQWQWIKLCDAQFLQTKHIVSGGPAVMDEHTCSQDVVYMLQSLPVNLVLVSAFVFDQLIRNGAQGIGLPKQASASTVLDTLQSSGERRSKIASLSHETRLKLLSYLLLAQDLRAERLNHLPLLPLDVLRGSAHADELNFVEFNNKNGSPETKVYLIGETEEQERSIFFRRFALPSDPNKRLVSQKACGFIMTELARLQSPQLQPPSPKEFAAIVLGVQNSSPQLMSKDWLKEFWLWLTSCPRNENFVSALFASSDQLLKVLPLCTCFDKNRYPDRMADLKLQSSSPLFTVPCAPVIVDNDSELGTDLVQCLRHYGVLVLCPAGRDCWQKEFQDLSAKITEFLLYHHFAARARGNDIVRALEAANLPAVNQPWHDHERERKIEHKRQ